MSLTECVRAAPRTSRLAMADSVPAAAATWLVSPAFDLLFIVNVLWPLFFFVGFYDDLAGQSALQFWQVYFVTTPHRWMTVLLVFGDPSRFRDRRQTFVAIAAIVVVVCTLVRLSTGTLTCLLAIDYIWNAWHFAAQHHGIYRLYAFRAARTTSADAVHKWIFRVTLLYVIFRVAAWSWQWEAFESLLHRADVIITGVLLVMLGREWWFVSPRAPGRSLYFSSVILLYLGLLWAVNRQRPDFVLALSTASALFHAAEYLAIVTWNVDQRTRQQHTRGLIRRMASVWILFLAAFALVLGISGWVIEHRWQNIWLTINVVIAFLHYAYDGIIWKRRAPRI